MPTSAEPRSVFARTLMLAILLLSACTRPLSCGKDTKVDFESPATKARPITIVIKSYRGSRQALADAALAMMNQSPRFSAGADPQSMNQTGSETLLLAATKDDPACVAMAVTYTTTASIAELTRMMRAIEERLTPIPDIDPKRPTVKVELWWVGGTSGSGHGWQLPNPLIAEEPWANYLFVSGSEPLFAGFAESHASERPWAIRVASMSTRNREEPVQRKIGSAIETPSIEHNEQGLLYRHGGVDEADVLALGMSLALMIDVHRQRYAHEPVFREEPWDMQLGLVQTSFEKRPLSWVEPVEVRVPAQATLVARYRLWVEAVRKAIDARSLGVGTVVVFDNQPELIRGAVIGERVARVQLAPAEGAEQAATIVPSPDERASSRFEITSRLPVPEAAQDAGRQP